MLPSSRKTWFIRLLTLAAICPLAITQASGSDDEDQLNTKLNAYVECYNSLDGSAHSSLARYASWVKNMKAGPSGREKVVYGLYQLSARDVSSCRDEIAKARELAPALPLDGAGAEYMKAVEGLHQVIEEMYPYYNRENYKDDKFAKGKQMHGRFVSQAALFNTASKRFSAELETENDKRLEVQMAALEKQDGRKLPYLKMALLHHAKRLVRVFEEETPRPDEILARLGAYEKAADEGVQYAKNNSQGLPIMWSMFASHIENFRMAAKERMRRLRDKTPYGPGEKAILNAGSGWMVSGSGEKVIHTYNDLVNSGNGLH